MSITVVGSIAFDAVKTPFGERDRLLGGAAFAHAASFFDRVRPVGPVGDDFGGAEVEPAVLPRAVQWHCQDRVVRHGNTTVVF